MNIAYFDQILDFISKFKYCKISKIEILKVGSSIKTYMKFPKTGISRFAYCSQSRNICFTISIHILLIFTKFKTYKVPPKAVLFLTKLIFLATNYSKSANFISVMFYQHPNKGNILHFSLFYMFIFNKDSNLSNMSKNLVN